MPNKPPARRGAKPKPPGPNATPLGRLVIDLIDRAASLHGVGRGEICGLIGTRAALPGELASGETGTIALETLVRLLRVAGVKPRDWGDRLAEVVPE